jgi:hypothetical protein
VLRNIDRESQGYSDTDANEAVQRAENERCLHEIVAALLRGIADYEGQKFRQCRPDTGNAPTAARRPSLRMSSGS